MASESVDFNFLSHGAPSLASDFRKVGDTSALAAKGARLCADALEKQRKAANVAAGASLALARADEIAKEAEHGLRDGALEAEFALKKQGEAAKEAAREEEAAAARMKAIRSSLKAPTGLGIAALLSPALIPVAGALAGATAAIGVSLGGAAVGAAAFGALAKTAFGQVSDAATKYQAAAAKAGLTAAGSKQRAAALKAEQAALAGLTGPQKQLVRNVIGIKTEWASLAASVATPVLAAWTGAAGAALTHLRPLVQPVADLFKSWGQTVDRYFSSAKGSAELGRLAGTLGRFSASQLAAIGGFFVNIGRAIGNLGRDLAAHGADFGAFGRHLTAWGDAFLAWSQSKAARDDVGKLLDWVRSNGRTTGDLLKNLGAVLAQLAPGLAGAGTLELKLITDFLGFIAALPKSIARPLLDVAGAMLVLSKLGVLNVGIKLVGPLAGKALSWLTGGVINIGGAAGMQTAADTMVTAAAAMQTAADTMAGAGAEGAAGGALGTGGAAAAGGEMATGFTAGIAGLGPLIGVAAGAGLALYLQKYHVFDKPPPAGQTGPRGFQPPGRLPGPGGVPLPSAATAWKQYDQAFNASVAGQIATMQDATTKITGDFARQGKAATAAMGDVDKLSGAITNNGVQSAVARQARQNLITDMEQAGVKASTAQTDVDAYSTAVAQNGVNSDQARGARTRLIGDILNASGNAAQGKRDLNNYTTAVQQHSANSDAVRGARTRLITDLENSGLSAKDATTLVDGLGTAVKKLPKGTSIDILMTGTGSYTITSHLGTSATSPYPGGISGRKAAGGFINMGTGPRADDVPILASKGEYVHQAAAVSKYGVGAMNAVNSGRAVIGYAAGGAVSGPLTPGFVTGMYDDFTKQFTGSMVSAMRTSLDAAEKAAQAAAAMADPFAGITGVPSGPPISGSAAAAQNFAKSILWAYGWGQDQFPPLRALWDGESGWRWNALNPGSGAYGIPQALPAGKMASAGADWRTNPATQIRWGLGYIKNTPGYGSPAVVYSKWLGRSPHWYAEGGPVPGMAAGGKPPAKPVIPSRWLHDPDLTALLAASKKEMSTFWPLMGATLPKTATPAQHRALAAWDKAVQRQQARTFGLTHGPPWRGGGLMQQLMNAYVNGRPPPWGAFGSAVNYLTREVEGAGIKGGIDPPGAPKGSGWLPYHFFHTKWGYLLSDLRHIPAKLKAAAPWQPGNLGKSHTATGSVLTFDRGGYLPAGLSMAYNGTGRPEPVGPAAQPAVHITIGSSGNTDFDAFMLRWIRGNVRVEGGGNVQAAYGR